MSSSIDGKRKVALAVPAVVALVVVGGVSYWTVALSRLPPERLYVEVPVETLSPIVRPGKMGVILLGPPRKELEFAINLYAPGIRPIVWSELRALDRTLSAYARVRFRIDEEGRPTGIQVSAAGFPQVERYLYDVVSTWRYYPYMTGTIELIVNLAGADFQFAIYEANLALNPDLEKRKDVVVKRGQLYYVRGLPTTYIRQLVK